MDIVENIINNIKNELIGVPGVVGVVLGGSRARGTHNDDSDIDIGVYYDKNKGFNINDIENAAIILNDEKKDQLISNIGDWGEWINGGGWLIIDGYHVDIIFRDIHKVKKVINESLTGNVSIHYQTGHPHGYLNIMYAGELAVSNILLDTEGTLKKLKRQINTYPEKMKESIIQYFLFEASFSLTFMEDNINKQDVFYVMGHCFRSIACLNQVIFAKNNEYSINEKKAVYMIDQFSKKPNNYKKRVEAIVTFISNNPEKLKKATEDLKMLIEEVKYL